MNALGEESIGSGVIFANDLILTNAHVVKGARSLRASDHNDIEVEATVIWRHPDQKCDIAVVESKGCFPEPTVDPRAPLLAEPVVVLAFPAVPQVTTRPLLAFDGTVSSREATKTYYGDEQRVISAVMGPGASGGAILGADGRLVGSVVQALAARMLAANNTDIEHSIYHASVPCDVIAREFRAHAGSVPYSAVKAFDTVFL
jgi:S1-C subfamily serine protease